MATEARPNRAGNPPGEKVRHPLTSAALAISALVLLYGAFLTISLIQEEDNAISSLATDLGRRLCPIDDAIAPGAQPTAPAPTAGDK